eukprot:g2736.t1
MKVAVRNKLSQWIMMLLLSSAICDPYKRSADRQILRDIVRRQEQEKEALQERHRAEVLAARDNDDSEMDDRAPKPVPLDEFSLRDFVVNGFVRLNVQLPLSFHDLIFNRTYAVLRDEFNHGNNVLARIPQLRRLLADPVVDGALRSVLGPEYILHPHRYCHESHPAAQPWHKDTYFDYIQSHWHNPHWAMIFYFPQDAPHELGPTRVARGSHILETGDGGGSLDEYELPAKAGDVYLFHYNLLHSGGRNVMRDWAGATGMQHSFANPSYNPPYPPRDRQRVVYKFQFVRIHPPSTRIAASDRHSDRHWKSANSKYRPWSEKLLPALPPPQPVSFETRLADEHRQAVLEIVAAALHRYVTDTDTSTTAIVSTSLAANAEIELHINAVLAKIHGTNISTDPDTNATGGSQQHLRNIASTPSDLNFVREALRQGLGYYRKHYQHQTQLQRRLTPLWRTIWAWLRGEFHNDACAGADGKTLSAQIGREEIKAYIALVQEGASSAAGDASRETEQLFASYSLAGAIRGGHTGLATAAQKALHAALRSRTSYVRTAAAHALGSIGPAAVAPLIAELKAEHARAAQLVYRYQSGRAAGVTRGSNSSECPSVPNWAKGAAAGAWTTPEWQDCDNFLAAVATALGGSATTATAASQAAKSLLPLLAPLRPSPLPSPSVHCTSEYAHNWTGWHQSDVLPFARRNTIEALGLIGSVLSGASSRRAPVSLHRVVARIADRLASIVEAANDQGDAELNPENGEGQSHVGFRTSSIARVTHRGFMAALALAQLGPRAAGLSPMANAHNPRDVIMNQLLDVLLLARFDASTNQFSAF